MPIARLAGSKADRVRTLILAGAVAVALAACAHAPPVAAPDPAYAVCGPDGAVDWDDNPSAPPPHCNRDGWGGRRYAGEPG